MNRRTFTAGLAAFSSAAILAGRGTTAAPRKPTAGNDAARAAQLISAIRQAAGLPPVSVDRKLTAAAEYQARSVAAAGSLSHGDFAGRVRSFGIAGAVAENLAYGSDDVAGAIAQWQGSAPHQANLLMAGARRIGLGRADSGSTRYWALVIG
ncbi:CAP domain-containing protein [uncultured Enterovirga sp.]|uniref:CAP domain-containing protein n=1 Tax=uncultured Enterovirga sp. TaxID=2026352 RepID=UPI0035CA8FAE